MPLARLRRPWQTQHPQALQLPWLLASSSSLTSTSTTSSSSTTTTLTSTTVTTTEAQVFVGHTAMSHVTWPWLYFFMRIFEVDLYIVVELSAYNVVIRFNKPTQEDSRVPEDCDGFFHESTATRALLSCHRFSLLNVLFFQTLQILQGKQTRATFRFAMRLGEWSKIVCFVAALFEVIGETARMVWQPGIHQERSKKHLAAGLRSESTTPQGPYHCFLKS